MGGEYDDDPEAITSLVTASRHISVSVGHIILAYVNPGGKGANGHCCDGRWGICESDCDHKFRICIDRDTGLNTNVFSCKYGSHQSTRIADQNSIRFGEAFGNVRNPITVALSAIPASGNISLKVDVWDDDGSLTSSDYVDTLRTLLSVNSHDGTKSKLVQSRTKLAIRWSTLCTENLYGARCQVRCIPGENYHCDQHTGKKICKKGWGGKNCDKLEWCHSNPCLNGATCTAHERGYKCTCPRGWSGLNCEIQGSPCDLNPCLPGGCINYVSTYICVCPPGYYATSVALNDSCEEMPTTIPPSTITTTRTVTRECTCPTCPTLPPTTTGVRTSRPVSITSPVPTTSTTKPVPSTSRPEERIVYINRPNADCDRLAETGRRYQDGVYTIHVSNFTPFPVYCDMSAVGWTVIQERVSGASDFYRSWDDYKNGFGEVGLGKNYFLGLQKIYYLTNQRRYKLRITVQLGDRTWRYANYANFRVESERNNYRLRLSGYSGNAGDALGAHNGDSFSTYDKDNDADDNTNCASKYQSGWWFHSRPRIQYSCTTANLNGRYVTTSNGWPTCYYKKCVYWSTIRNYGANYSLVKTSMKILPISRD